MILTVSDFCVRVLGDGLNPLIVELCDLTGRATPEEMKAWEQSFTRLAQVLQAPSLSNLHLYLGERGNLALEYRLPASASWCDVVLLGRNNSTPAAVILELKHWDTRRDQAVSIAPGLVDRPEGLTLHPSDQVKGYTEYCRHFHSAVAETKAGVDGCVVFTAYPLNPIYTQAPNDALTTAFPCFSLGQGQQIHHALAFLNTRLTAPAPEFAERFGGGHYHQDRSFIQAVGETIRRSPHRALELLDEQRLGLRLAWKAVREALADATHGAAKRVVIVEGPPGSGKSAIAAQLWAELASEADLPPGNLAFVSTSVAQNDNWEHLFGAGEGAVKKASSFCPATMPEFNRLARKFPGAIGAVEAWRDNLQFLRNLNGRLDPPDDGYRVSVVDEAHALVNPESPDARGTVGFPIHLGPLGYHIIRASQVSVFFLDERQGFRDKETTSRVDLETWAKELGAEVLPVVSLKERQFRCGGSTEYVTWVEKALTDARSEFVASSVTVWRRTPERFSIGQEKMVAEDSPEDGYQRPRGRFRFELIDTPEELDQRLLDHHRDGNTVRLVSSYAREWKTENATRPHQLPNCAKDFVIRGGSDKPERIWARIWNWKNAPQGYVGWVDPCLGVPMHDDPLCEIGCPFTVRGFDFDYLGLLWLGDVVWRTDRWKVNITDVHERGLSRHKQRAQTESDLCGPKHQALLERLLQGYRILMTRALKGIYVWCEDQETKERLQNCLGEE